MLLKIVLRLSVLALCFTALSTYAADWFRIDKIPSTLTDWLLELIKDKPGTVITIAICFISAFCLWYNTR